jgi:transcription elongation factor GreA
VTDTATSSTTWLTQEAFERLHAELEDRRGPGRHEIVRRIESAREEGDLRENGGYHAAKEEQGKNEARIRELEQMLRFAKVGAAPTASGVVQQGTLVRVTDAAGGERRFLLGSREDAPTVDVQVVSPQSPLGGAVLNKKVGEQATYRKPNGTPVTVTVVSAEPWNG